MKHQAETPQAMRHRLPEYPAFRGVAWNSAETAPVWSAAPSIMTARVFNPLLKEFAARLKLNGKTPKQIIIAIMRKLLHHIYGNPQIRVALPYIRGMSLGTDRITEKKTVHQPIYPILMFHCGNWPQRIHRIIRKETLHSIGIKDNLKSAMLPSANKGTILFTIVSMALATTLNAKPLKVFILCGQSNMEGHAQTRTFPAIAKDPKTADLHKQMVAADGNPVVCDKVWIAYSFGDFGGNPVGKKAGKLTAGFGSQHHVGTGKIGPEFTFGISMQKHLGEPVLLIKSAWGGKSLMVDFRPPSAGEIADEKSKTNAGKYYGLMMEHVKEILADPKKVYPDYDPKDGYELAGFVWFQGFNDLVGSYPSTAPSEGKKAIKDYSEYSRLLACLIRDVRKDLTAPKLPFVTGVLGVGGATTGDNAEAFRKAMAAPAEMEEFKGNVANVFTHTYWPVELDEVIAKSNAAKSEFAARDKEINEKRKNGGDCKKEMAALDAEKRAKIEQTLTPDELFLLDNGISNAGYHYHGSAKFFAQIGKAFSDALMDFRK